MPIADPDERRAYFRKYQKEWRKKHRKRLRLYRRGRRDKKVREAEYLWRMRKEHGISSSEYKKMVDLQQNRCKICNTEQEGRRLYLDHDHSTKAIRSLLCHKCNSILGFAKDSPELLEDAAAYLRKHQCQSKQS